MKQRERQGEKNNPKGALNNCQKSSTDCNSQRPPWGCSWFCLSDLKERQGKHAGKRLQTEELINKGWTSRRRKGRLKSSTFCGPSHWIKDMLSRSLLLKLVMVSSYCARACAPSWCKMLFEINTHTHWVAEGQYLKLQLVLYFASFFVPYGKSDSHVFYLSADPQLHASGMRSFGQSQPVEAIHVLLSLPAITFHV